MRIQTTFIATIQIALAVTLMAFLAVGSVSGAFAASGDHGHVAADTSAAHDHGLADVGAFGAVCPSGHGEAHDAHAGDGMCCVGMCAAIVQTAPVLNVPARRLVVIEPFYAALLPRAIAVSFIRPPSPTI